MARSREGVNKYTGEGTEIMSEVMANSDEIKSAANWRTEGRRVNDKDLAHEMADLENMRRDEAESITGKFEKHEYIKQGRKQSESIQRRAEMEIEYTSTADKMIKEAMAKGESRMVLPIGEGGAFTGVKEAAQNLIYNADGQPKIPGLSLESRLVKVSELSPKDRENVAGYRTGKDGTGWDAAVVIIRYKSAAENAE